MKCYELKRKCGAETGRRLASEDLRKHHPGVKEVNKNEACVTIP